MALGAFVPSNHPRSKLGLSAIVLGLALALPGGALAGPATAAINALKADFLPRRGGQRHAALAGKYVLVLPVDPPWRLLRDPRLIQRLI